MSLEPLDKALAILSGLTDEQIDSLPPAERRRLADQCMRMAVRCTPVSDIPDFGILRELKHGKGFQ
jgi:hypothetical protein